MGTDYRVGPNNTQIETPNGAGRNWAAFWRGFDSIIDHRVLAIYLAGLLIGVAIHYLFTGRILF